MLAVSPEYQRHGIGTMLVEFGQKLARDDGVPLTLDASPVGTKLYEKRGFSVANKGVGMEGPMTVWKPEIEEAMT